MPANHPLRLGGERLTLLADKAVWWPAERLLFVADLHLGKSATLRAASIAIPPGTTADTLNRLAGLARRKRARQIVILGDLVHSRHANSPQTHRAIVAWRDSLPPFTSVVLIPGNHDAPSGRPDDAWRINTLPEGTRIGPFALHHLPNHQTDAVVLCGHLHPAVRLVGPARKSLRLPCFVAEKSRLILPAFGSFTGTAVIRPSQDDRIFVVAEKNIIAIHPRPRS